ncbi:MAG: glycosyltransferase family 2 protein [Candidatus Omnitrophota bacterium]|nr:glycosyltransferase family 2 protein [Candidatus Omnitrophota bacterium]
MISIVIATHNNLLGLKQCLQSLSNQSYANREIIVVFNHSPGALMDEARNCSPEVKRVVNKENLLFCKAYNQGIVQSRGEFVLCLNDDVFLEPNFIEELIRTAELDDKIGMASGKILRIDRKTIDSTGLFLGKSRKPVERGFNQQDNGQYDKEGYVFGVSGCAAFYRRLMLEDIKNEQGYFDERYGMFYEDLDVAWRANKKGWKGYYTPWAVAYHQRGASSQTNAATGILKRYNFARLPDQLKVRLIHNRHLTINKNDSRIGFLLHLPFILAYELKLYLYLIFFAPQVLMRLREKGIEL